MAELVRGISEGDDEVEILVVEIQVGDIKIRSICAYGPKDTDVIDRKEKFWARLSSEVEDANINELFKWMETYGVAQRS